MPRDWISSVYRYYCSSLLQKKFTIVSHIESVGVLALLRLNVLRAELLLKVKKWRTKHQE